MCRSDIDNYRRIDELETKIAVITERDQVLTGLMTKGYLESALFNKERNTLMIELDSLRDQKDSLARLINSNLTKVEEVNRLLRFAARAEMLTAFDGDLFTESIVLLFDCKIS